MIAYDSRPEQFVVMQYGGPEDGAVFVAQPGTFPQVIRGWLTGYYRLWTYARPADPFETEGQPALLEYRYTWKHYREVIQ